MIMAFLAAWTVAVGTTQPAQTIGSHLGTYQGTLRNAAGVLQLGGADATKSVVVLSVVADSLRLEAIDQTGSMRRIATWPLSRVKTQGDSLTASGGGRGALHLRRTLIWKRSGGIRVNAELTTAYASQREDDYFGGSRVTLTLVKIR